MHEPRADRAVGDRGVVLHHLAGQDTVHIGPDGLVGLRAEHLGYGPPQHVGGRDAEQVIVGAVGEDVPPLGVQAGDEDGHIVGQRLQAAFALARFLFGGDAGGDVHRDAGHSADRACRVAHDLPLGLDPAHSPVGVYDTVDGVVVAPHFQGLPGSLDEQVPVVRIDHAQDGLQCPIEGARRKPAQGLQIRRADDEVGGGVPGPGAQPARREGARRKALGGL